MYKRGEEYKKVFKSFQNCIYRFH